MYLCIQRTPQLTTGKLCKQKLYNNGMIVVDDFEAEKYSRFNRVLVLT